MKNKACSIFGQTMILFIVLPLMLVGCATTQQQQPIRSTPAVEKEVKAEVPKPPSVAERFQALEQSMVRAKEASVITYAFEEWSQFAVRVEKLRIKIKVNNYNEVEINAALRQSEEQLQAIVAKADELRSLAEAEACRSAMDYFQLSRQERLREMGDGSYQE